MISSGCTTKPLKIEGELKEEIRRLEEINRKLLVTTPEFYLVPCEPLITAKIDSPKEYLRVNDINMTNAKRCILLHNSHVEYVRRREGN